MRIQWVSKPNWISESNKVFISWALVHWKTITHKQKYRKIFSSWHLRTLVLCDWHMRYSHTHSTNSTYIKSIPKKNADAKHIFYPCFSMKFIEYVFSRHFNFIYREHQDVSCLSPRELATDWINRSLYYLKIQFNLSHPRQKKHSKKVINENSAMLRSSVTPGTAAGVGAEPYQVFFPMEGCSNADKLPVFIISKVGPFSYWYF